ncbi:integrase [Pseudomonas sp. MWU12-2037]|uniref:tyrosine-type recombinase/integrase n=1 Tax=Pseudomonas sp. MWU12-2037 TaxID=2928690 RepID=UPI00200D9AB9|nr:integrase [Pseudomonas sp. MWU12-2037]
MSLPVSLSNRPNGTQNGTHSMANGTQKKDSKRKFVTDAELRALSPGETATESLPGRGTGSIYFECRASGAVEAYYRQRLQGKAQKIKMGIYSAQASGFTLAALRGKAQELARQALEHGDLKLYRAESEAKATAERLERERQLVEVQRQTVLAARRGSFKELLDAYVADLEARGKVKAKEVKRLFQTHIIEHHPDLTALLACDITGEDIHRVMTTLLSRKPKGRGIGNKGKASASNNMRTTAASVHRYLKAAFNYGSKAHLSLDRDVSESKIFDISNNPATKVPTLANVRGGNTESMTPEELGSLLRHLDTLSAREAAICKGLIYLGGQRMEQLLRVTWEEISDDLLHLTDGKGQKSKAWDHLLPITDRIKQILQPLFNDKIGPGPFCIGRRCIRPDTAGKRFSDAGKALSVSGATRYFSYANVRVTAETLMAAIGITKETRSWLLSHGRNDVQSVHYDRYSYLPEKRSALELWGKYLDCLHTKKAWSSGKVILLSRKRLSSLQAPLSH